MWPARLADTAQSNVLFTCTMYARWRDAGGDYVLVSGCLCWRCDGCKGKRPLLLVNAKCRVYKYKTRWSLGRWCLHCDSSTEWWSVRPCSVLRKRLRVRCGSLRLLCSWSMCSGGKTRTHTRHTHSHTNGSSTHRFAPAQSSTYTANANTHTHTHHISSRSCSCVYVYKRRTECCIYKVKKQVFVY